MSLLLRASRGRRHLTSSQKATIAVALLPELEKEKKKQQIEAGGDRKSEAYQKSVVEQIQQAIGDEAKVWVIKNQLGRRNLILYQRSELALELEEIFAKRAKERQQEGGRTKLPQNSSEAPQNRETREQIAKIAHVSHDTIHPGAVCAVTRVVQTQLAL